MPQKRGVGFPARHELAMDVSQKEGPQRTRRARSVPPPDVAETAALMLRVSDEEVPRFLGVAAPLAVLSAELRQARSDHDSARVAALSVRLSRQLMRRNIELREAIGLLEKAFEIAPDSAIAQELGEAWAGVGDYVRGASYLAQAAEGQPAPDRARLLCQMAHYFAHAGKVPQALQALKQAMALAPLDPRPHEMLGAMGFWADFPASEASHAYLEAARRRAQAGDEAQCLEALLRAFEIAPAERTVADALAAALRDRRRAGAADEIIREHLRSGSASARAAHYERTFQAVLAAQKWTLALEAALEAELDSELDLDALDLALDELERSTRADGVAWGSGSASAPPKTFEAFLVRLARYGWPGQDGTEDAARFAEWLGVLVALHVCNWGDAEVTRIARRLETLLSLGPIRPETRSESLHELRSRLTRSETPAQELALRGQIALLEAERANFHEAYDVLRPVLDGTTGSRDFRVLAMAVLAAGRARQSAGRAQTLSYFARFLPDEPAAVASAVAAETLLSEGMVHAAADAARYAVEADPASPRAVAAQALVALTHPDRATPGQIESSLSVLVARGTACQLLAQSAAQAGAPHLALTWAERQVALRPADPSAVREVLERAAYAGDAARLVERIDALLMQPLPMVEVGADVAQALERLVELSHDEAERAARLVLTKAGIRSPDCREALAHVAKVTGRPRLAADLSERLLVLAPSRERARLLLELAELRMECGDGAAAARALRRALASGAPREQVAEALGRVSGPLEPDGEISKLETELEIMPDAPALDGPDAQDEASGPDKARLLRRLGVMRFDVAQDTQGAIAAWMRAADLDRELGLDRLAYYLTVVAGADEAPVLLEKAASYTDDPTRKARLLGLAARAMLDVRRPADALRLAISALEQAPLQTEFLAVAERAATPEDTAELERLYRRAAEAALGRYGERAIHYRAARILEKRGQADAALRHAGLAFAAVPAEGAAFVLMVRLADASSDPTPAIHAIEQVAEATKSEAERSRWLDKAASLTSMAAGGSRQRVEILLRAAHLRSEATTIAQLEAALLDLEVLDKSEQKAIERRVQALGTEALLHSSGAHGALLCIALGGLYLRVFDDLELGASCLLKAASSDIEVPDYQKLRDLTARWSERAVLFDELMTVTRQAKRDRGQLLGRGLAELIADLAAARGQAAIGAEFLTVAASDAPEDLELVGLARKAAEATGRADLLTTIGDLLPPEERARLLLSRLPGLSEEAALTALLDLERGALGAELELAVELELGSRLLAAARYGDAVDVFRQALELAPADERALLGLLAAAEGASDYDELARVLKLRADAARDAGERRELLLRRARLLERELARIGEARAVLEAMLAEGEDVEVLDLLAQSLDASGDAERAAELWLRARTVSTDAERNREFVCRAARAYGEAGLDRAALDLLTPLELDAETARLVLQLARRAQDRVTELRALCVLAPLEPEHSRDEAFLSAARIALGLGDHDQAETLSRRAADGDSDEALQAKTLTWQLALGRRGSFDAATAELVLAELGPASGVTGASQREIRAYLLAVATLTVRGEDEARKLLVAAVEEQGQRPLLAAALAPLLARAGGGPDDAHASQALELYEAAIGGDLHGLLREGALLLEAAEVARALGDGVRARGFASAVGDDDPRRRDAAQLLEDLAAEEARVLRLERERRQAEEERLIAEERRRVAEAAEAERQRAEAERLRAEAAEAERQRAEAERLRAEAAAAEAERLRAEAAEAERQRAEAERLRAAAAEAERLRAEAAEAERQRAEAERLRAAAAAAEAERLRVEAAAAEAERARVEAAAAEEAERLHAEARAAAAAAEAERLRVEAAAAEAERLRAAEAERERVEAERLRAAEAAEAERERVEAERLRAEAAAAEAERARVEAAEAERRAEQARLAEDERRRVEDERRRAEEKEAETARQVERARQAEEAQKARASAARPSSSELQATVVRELSAAEAAAQRREVGAMERRKEREKKVEETLRREQAEHARAAARREDDEARRRLSGELAVESLVPRRLEDGSEPPGVVQPTVALSAQVLPEVSLVESPRKEETDEDREQVRRAREEALRLAREEAARERALAPAADQKRASTVPPPRRSTRPPGARSLAPLARRGSDRPAAPASTAELEFPADETSVVQVTLGELREVDELTPAEEAVAAHPAGWAEDQDAPSQPQSAPRDAHKHDAEEELVSRLEAGDVDAGVALLDRLQADRARARDAVAVAGHLVLLRPGDGSLLGRLVASASRDGNEALALAVRHVLGSFGAGEPVAAPSLDRVGEVPERTQAVLFRGLRGAGVEALTLVWEHASALFRREPVAYGITGADRVPATAPTPLAELYRDAGRVLGMIRTPLFRAGTGEDISMRVLLLSPPAVLVSGRVDQVTTELAFHFGAALGAAMPEHALLYGLEPEALSNLLSALTLSFGGDARATAGSGRTQAVRFASLLWEAIPPRVQRRLSTLCAQKDQLSVDTCFGYSTLVLRRAGLLVSGDVRTAVVDACESAGIASPRSLAELAQAARIAPAVADLLQLAVSPEYAELRFRTGRTG